LNAPRLFKFKSACSFVARFSTSFGWAKQPEGATATGAPSTGIAEARSCVNPIPPPPPRISGKVCLVHVWNLRRR
jgi:hypothetical protein